MSKNRMCLRAGTRRGYDMLPERTIFSEDHNLFRQTARRFFKNECEPFIKEWEKRGMFDPGLFRKAAE